MTAAIAASPVLPQPLTSSGLLNLLIVEEDRTLREMSRAVATSLGYRAISAESTDQALRMLDGQDIDVVLLDFKLHGLTGVQALRQIKALRADLEVVVVTSSNSVEAAVEAMKAGAFDYLSKPFTLEELTVALEHAASHLHLKAENRLLREKLKSKQGFGNIIGRAPEMDKLYRIIAKAAHSMHPVLILGESGTGGRDGGAGYPLFGAVSGQAVYSGGLRFAGTNANRERTFRSRERRIYRRGPGKRRASGDRGGRNGVPRRGWRVAGGFAGEDATRAAGEGDSAGWKYQERADQRASSRRHQPRPPAGRTGGSISPRFVFPPERAERADPAFERAPPGHPPAGDVYFGAPVARE